MADPWIKVWWDWYVSRSHVLLSFDALHIGPFLMNLAKASPEPGWLVQPNGKPFDPYTLGALARMPGSHAEIEARMGAALLELVDCGTLVRTEGGFYGFDRDAWARFQSRRRGGEESEGAERTRRYRQRREEKNEPSQASQSVTNNTVTVTPRDVYVTRHETSLSDSDSVSISDSSLSDLQEEECEEEKTYFQGFANDFAHRLGERYVTRALRNKFPRFLKVLREVFAQRGEALTIPDALDRYIERARESEWLNVKELVYADWLIGTKLKDEEEVEDRILKILDGKHDKIDELKRAEGQAARPKTQAQTLAEMALAARREEERERASGALRLPQKTDKRRAYAQQNGGARDRSATLSLFPEANTEGDRTFMGERLGARAGDPRGFRSRDPPTA